MDFLKKWVVDWLLKDVIGKVAKFLNGKKTTIGAASLLLWGLIYVLPILHPGAAALIPFVETIRVGLENAGVHFDAELLATGTSFTVVGLIHKVIKLFSKE